MEGERNAVTYSRSYSRPSRDDNHAIVVDALRLAGAFVVDLGAVGGGVPDLIVFRHGATYLLEVKNPETHARRAKGPVPHFELLTDEQIAWLSMYGASGPRVHIVTGATEALAVVCATSDEVESVEPRQ